MPHETVRRKGKEFVLVPRHEYERLQLKLADRRAAMKVKRGLAQLRAGTSKAAPLTKIKRELGL